MRITIYRVKLNTKERVHYLLLHSLCLSSSCRRFQTFVLLLAFEPWCLRNWKWALSTAMLLGTATNKYSEIFSWHFFVTKYNAPIPCVNLKFGLSEKNGYWIADIEMRTIRITVRHQCEAWDICQTRCINKNKKSIGR